MARIRTIKPEIWASPDVADLNIWERLTFIGLITQVDDAGRWTGPNWGPLVMTIFPNDGVTSDQFTEWLKALEDRGMVVIYANGRRRCLALPNWAKHQKIDRPGKSKIPAPPTRDGSANPQESPGVPRDAQGEFRRLDESPGMPKGSFEDSMNPIEDSMNPIEDSMNPIEDSMNPIEDSMNPISRIIGLLDLGSKDHRTKGSNASLVDPGNSGGIPPDLDSEKFDHWVQSLKPQVDPDPSQLAKPPLMPAQPWPPEAITLGELALRGRDGRPPPPDAFVQPHDWLAERWSRWQRSPDRANETPLTAAGWTARFVDHLTKGAKTR